MAELKPRLIITSPGKKRRGFGTFITVLVIFALGFYAGYKYGDYLLGTGTPEVRTQNPEPVSTIEELAVSAEQNDSGDEKRDILYSEDSEATKAQQSLVEEGLYGDELRGDTASSQINDPEEVDQMLIISDADNVPQEVLAANNLTVGPDNEHDAALEDTVTSTNGYTLQVGAFSTAEEAQGVVDGYKSKGYEAYLVPIENSRGEKWNLVKIGKFNTIDQAWSYASYFQNREGLEAYVETIEQGTVFNESWGQQELSEQ